MLDSGGAPREVCGPWRISYPQVGCANGSASAAVVGISAVLLALLGADADGGMSYSPARNIVRPGRPGREARMSCVAWKAVTNQNCAVRSETIPRSCIMIVVVDSREEKTGVFPWASRPARQDREDEDAYSGPARGDVGEVTCPPRPVRWPSAPCGLVRP